MGETPDIQFEIFQCCSKTHLKLLLFCDSEKIFVRFTVYINGEVASIKHSIFSDLRDCWHILAFKVCTLNAAKRFTQCKCHVKGLH